MATATPTITNGVNVTQLVDTIELIKKDPSLARFRFRSRTRWEQGGRCVTEISGFYGAGAEATRARTHTLAGDEPPVLLGSDTAPNAVDLHAFLGLSEDTRPGFERITFTATVKADAPRAKLEELCEYVQRTSPVLDIIRNPVPVSIRLVSE